MEEPVLKSGKKRWHVIIAPKIFNNVQIGETLAIEPSDMIGKRLKCSLMNLVNDSKRQNANILFEIVEVEGDKGKTRVIGYGLVNSSIKRLVRRDSEKMDISFACKTSDNIALRAKLIIITKSSVKGSIAAKIISSAEAFMVKNVKKLVYEDVIQSLISHKIQDSVKDELDKIYPLKACEIRYIGIEETAKPQKVEVEAEQK